ncbi:MAG: hypothetical protein ACOYMS_03410, partial [Terrimicrobiaceae bacterium]
MTCIRTCWIAIAIALVHPVKANENRPPIPLVEERVGRFGIVVPSGESEKTLEAANLLKEILEKCTGASVAIAREASAAGNLEIVVASEKVFPNPTPEEATKLTLNNQQWWSMKSKGSQIWLTGNDAGMRTGTRDAVVMFLEDVVGARFFHFGRNGQVLPESKSVVFSSPDKTIIPDSGYRALYPYHQGKIDMTS